MPEDIVLDSFLEGPEPGVMTWRLCLWVNRRSITSVLSSDVSAWLLGAEPRRVQRREVGADDVKP